MEERWWRPSEGLVAGLLSRSQPASSAGGVRGIRNANHAAPQLLGSEPTQSKDGQLSQNARVTVGSTTRPILVLLLVAVVHASEGSQAAAPVSQPLGARLVGHWSLVSFETVSGGRVEYPFGPGAVGEIRYDAAGHVAVQIMKTGRSLFASGDQAAGTVEEVSAAFTGYLAYYGTYSVDERASVVTHHLAASMFPNWVGSEQRREVSFEGDRLTLSTPPTLFQGKARVFRLVWRRLE